jgi:hypothetical protein
MPEIYREETIERAKVWVPSFWAQHEGITSADELYAAMRETQYYVPRWAVREAWAEGVRALGNAEFMNRLPEYYVPPESRHDDRPWKTQEEWVYHVKITGTDYLTGLPLSQYVTVETPERISISEIKSAALGTIGQYNFDPFKDLESEIEEYIHATGGYEE